jgi:hypothetical protein
MAEYRNRVGGVFALTVFTPILPGHEAELRAHLAALPVGAESPLARLDALHLSRIQVIGELVDQGPPHRRETLKRSHLLFTSTVDGDLDPYLDAICERIGAEADGWWGHCDGYPGTGDRAAFRRWIRAHKVDTSLLAVANPGATVRDVRESLALRERVVDFAAEVQGLDAAALRERFLAAFADVRR